MSSALYEALAIEFNFDQKIFRNLLVKRFYLESKLDSYDEICSGHSRDLKVLQTLQ